MSPANTPKNLSAQNSARKPLNPPLPLVGLTGGIGSGKTQISNRLSALGVPVVDTDCIAHELTTAQGAAMPAIAQAFGPQVLNPDGSLNRTYMRSLVFADTKHKHTLESILHPAIRQKVASQVQALATTQNQAAPYAVVVVPLLFESTQWQQGFWQIVVVDCTPEQQIARVQARNAWPLEQIHAVRAQQVSRETRLAGAHHVVCNDDTKTTLLAQVDALHKKLMLMAG
jgi:dephospho-CoA kinase